VIVLDCSYTLAMVMPDEARPPGMARTAAGRMLVPSLWAYEVANALRSGLRRRRVDETQVAMVCTRLEGLGIETVGSADMGVRQRFVATQTHQLSAYDAAYVELALNLHCPLATLDAGLADAARRAGLRIVA
jgi:predicted nucleic acid-binding protein